MSSILKRFGKKKEKKKTKTKKEKNVVLKEERDRRAKLNFTKDSFKKVQDDAYELRERFEGEPFSDHTPSRLRRKCVFMDRKRRL